MLIISLYVLDKLASRYERLNVAKGLRTFPHLVRSLVAVVLEVPLGTEVVQCPPVPVLVGADVGVCAHVRGYVYVQLPQQLPGLQTCQPFADVPRNLMSLLGARRADVLQTISLHLI